MSGASTHAAFAVVLSIVTAVAVAGSPLTFSIETVDADGDTGFGPAIAIAPDGAPHIAYVNRDHSMLRHAEKTTGGWMIQDVVPANEQWGSALVFDAEGRAIIAYVGSGAHTATRDGGTWRIEYLVGCYGASALSLASAADGSVHACVLGSCSGGVYVGVVDYALRTGATGWAGSNVEWRSDNFAYGGWCSIAAGNASTPHIALRNDGSGMVSHIYRTGDSWTREPIALGSANSIALDTSGTVHVAFYDDVAHVLRLAHRGASEWSVELVDDAGDVGRSCSMAIDTMGTFHVAYYDATHGDVKYARRAASEAAWSIQTVASEGDVGEQLGLAVDADGEVHIAYLDRTHLDLDYATTRRSVDVQPSSWTGALMRYR